MWHVQPQCDPMNTDQCCESNHTAIGKLVCVDSERLLLLKKVFLVVFISLFISCFIICSMNFKALLLVFYSCFDVRSMIFVVFMGLNE